jgi:starvation-inducible DNA-binding protein
MLHSTRIDLSPEIRSQVVDRLNETLAYTLDLKTQVKQAHWNVKGLDFYQLHSLFDEMAGELEEYIDLVAERVTTLAGVAMGTVRMAAKASQLPEYPVDILEGKDHLIALADRYAQYAKLLRDGIDATDELGDADTADLYTEVSRSIDMRLWFLEAHLQTDAAGVTSGNGATKAMKTPAKTAAKSVKPEAKTTAKTTAKALAKADTKGSSGKKGKPKGK